MDWCDDDYYIIFLLLLCLYVVASFKYSRGEGDNLSIHTLELASLAKLSFLLGRIPD